MSDRKKNKISKSEGGVNYTCNFSHKNYTSEEFKKEIIYHSDKLSHAVMLDCSFNNIDVLILKKFKQIETLKASNNLLYKSDLELSRLKCLDFSFNKFREIPDLKNLKNLEIILLNFNLITEIEVNKFGNILELTAIDLSNNKIRFKSVQDFNNVISFFSTNLSNLEKLSLNENYFTFDEIYFDKYFEYVSNKIEQLKMLNKVSIPKHKNKDLRILMLDYMIEKEEKSKNTAKVLENSVNLFEKILLDEANFLSKFSNVLETLTKYILEIENTIPDNKNIGEEYTHDDTDSAIFDKFIHLSSIAVEKFPKIDMHLISIFINFSAIRKGKWAKKCFSFLRHIAITDENLQTSLQSHILSKYTSTFQLLSQVNAETKINVYFDKLTQKTDLENILTNLPLVIRGIKHFIDPNFPNVVKMFYTNLMYVFENSYYNQNISVVLDFMKENYKSKINKNIKELYEKTIKFYLFKYTVNVVYLCCRTKCISIITPLIKGKHIEFFLNTSRNFCKEINIHIKKEEVDFKKSEKLKQKLFTICLKFINNKNYTNKQQQDLINKVLLGMNTDKTHIIELLKESVNNFFINGEYKFFSPQKKLLSKSEVEIIVIKSQTFSIFFKLYFFLTIKLDYYLKQNFNHILGLITTAYDLRISELVEDGRIDMNYNPFIMTLANYISHKILKFNNIYFTGPNEYKVFFNKFSSSFKTILEFINDESPIYKHGCRIAHVFLNYEIGLDINCISSINLNGNHIMIKLINSIINLLMLCGNEGKYEKVEEYKRMYVKFNAEMNDAKRDDYLINCLNIPNERIKTKIMTCFLTVKYEEFSSKELSKLLKTISNSNWSEGRMEKIISDTFFFMMKLFNENFIQNNPPFENANVIGISLKILEKNTERVFFKKEDAESLLALNTSIVTLLINLSGYSNFNKLFISDNSYVKMIKKTLINEFNYANIDKKNQTLNSNKVMFPLNIEKCYVMSDINNIKEVLTGHESLNPYNYVSLRLFCHMANILMNIPFKTFDIYKQDKFNIKEVLLEVNNLEVEMIKNENLTWPCFKRNIKQKFPQSVNNKSFRLNEWIILDNKTVYDNHVKFVENFGIFFEWLTGLTASNELGIKLSKDKFDLMLLNPDKVSFFKKDANTLLETIELINKGVTDKEIKKRDLKEYAKFILRTYDPQQEKENNFLKYKYNHIKNDFNIIDNYGSSIDNINRQVNLETVDNIQLRAIFISTFLRAIHTVLKGVDLYGRSINPNNITILKLKSKFSSHGKKEPKFMMRDILRTAEIFNNLVVFIDSSKLLYSNVASKILSILSLVFENIHTDLEIENGSEKLEKLIMISTIMISKVINMTFNKWENSSEKIILLKNLVKCCMTIIQEIFFLDLDKNFKLDLINKILSKKLIYILISNIADTMDNENKKLQDLEYNGKLIYSITYYHLLRLLGEYMTISENRAHYIIEIFMKKSYLENKAIRKTFVKEVSEFYKFSQFKHMTNITNGKDNNIDEQIHVKYKDKILFVSDCLLFHTKTKDIAKKLIFLNERSIYFIDYNDKYFEKKMDFSSINITYTQHKESIKNINTVYFSSFFNRIFISFKENFGFSLLFKNTLMVALFYMNIMYLTKENKMENNSIRVTHCCNLFDNSGNIIQESENETSDNKIEEGEFTVKKNNKFLTNLNLSLNEKNSFNIEKIENKNNKLEESLFHLENLPNAKEFKEHFKKFKEEKKNLNDVPVLTESKNNIPLMTESRILQTKENFDDRDDKIKITEQNLNQSNISNNGHLKTVGNIKFNFPIKNENNTSLVLSNNNPLIKTLAKIFTVEKEYNEKNLNSLLKKNRVFLASIESNYLCDCFSMEDRYIKNPKVLVFPAEIENLKIEEIINSKMTIYTENYDDILKLQFDDLNLIYSNSVWYKSIYKKSDEYALKDISYILFESPNIIHLTIGGTIKLILHDDYTYFSVRKILLTIGKLLKLKKIETD